TYLGLNEGEPVAMLAQYYDTSDRLLRSRKIGLRMRSESGETICCLKLRDASNDGLHVHEEYECPADSLEAGLQQLPEEGAPIELCRALRAAELSVVAETKFSRRRAIWKDPMFTAELSFDEGMLSSSGKSIPVGEVECEQKGGDEASFEEACQILACRFSLKPESRSKLSRALDLEHMP
ncbi:MAG: inorganic triphosphatase, partial [Butyricicoccus sp.]